MRSRRGQAPFTVIQRAQKPFEAHFERIRQRRKQGNGYTRKFRLEEVWLPFNFRLIGSLSR